MARKKHRLVNKQRDPNVATVSDLPQWLFDKINARRAAWDAGALATCLHNPRPGDVAYMAAWKPDLVTCPQCTHLVLVGRNTQEEYRCDCCGHVVANTDADHLLAALIKLPRLTFAIALCGDCRATRMN
jgi:hypothetical protein